MRTTKFKVWDKINKKWIDDSDIAINQQGLLFIRYEHQVSFNPISLTKSKNYEIVFFTGLHDKNRKEIYEGDMVKFKAKYEGDWLSFIKSVIYQDAGFRLYGFPNWKEYKDLEIIGNIYEDKELLK